MRRRLVLVRHAQAAGKHPRGDHARVLTEQGWLDAVELGHRLGQQGLVPGHVLVSTAARAQQTVSAMRDGLGEPTAAGEQVRSERRVYDGGVDGVVEALREVPAEAAVLWVVGHEPVMSTTTWQLSDPGLVPEDLRRTLTSGLPTATAAVLELDEVWSEVGFGGARLVALHTGRAG